MIIGCRTHCSGNSSSECYRFFIQDEHLEQHHWPGGSLKTLSVVESAEVLSPSVFQKYWSSKKPFSPGLARIPWIQWPLCKVSMWKGLYGKVQWRAGKSNHTNLTLSELARRRVIPSSLSFHPCTLGDSLAIDTSSRKVYSGWRWRTP